MRCCPSFPYDAAVNDDAAPHRTAAFVYVFPHLVPHTHTVAGSYVQQDGEQLAQDQAKAREMFKRDDGDAGGKPKLESNYEGMGIPESCSCIEGNPCLDEYGCRDWHHRFEIASQNGWKGFQVGGRWQAS